MDIMSEESRSYQDKFMLRLPDGMRDLIAKEAAANGRSMNAEIVQRLTYTLEMSEASRRIKKEMPPPSGLAMAIQAIEFVRDNERAILEAMKARGEEPDWEPTSGIMEEPSPSSGPPDAPMVRAGRKMKAAGEIRTKQKR